MPEETVQFSRIAGPVTVEITSGFSTAGPYILACRRDALGAHLVEFGSTPKFIDDDIADIHLVPVAPEALDQQLVVILGKYRPAFGHTQVKVTYRFQQAAQTIHTTEIAETLDAGEAFRRYTHSYRFQEVVA